MYPSLLRLLCTDPYVDNYLIHPSSSPPVLFWAEVPPGGKGAFAVSEHEQTDKLFCCDTFSTISLSFVVGFAVQAQETILRACLWYDSELEGGKSALQLVFPPFPSAPYRKPMVCV